MKREFAALTLIALTAVGFYCLVLAGMNAILKTIAVVALLVACSFSLQRLLKIEGEYGLLLVRTKKGLKFIDELAQSRPHLWNFLADVGLVMGFGLSALLIFRHRTPKKAIITGIILLMLFYQFVLPLAAPLVVELIQLPGASQDMSISSSAAAQAASGQGGLLATVLAVLATILSLSTIIGGVALAGALALLLKAFTILFAIASFATTALAGHADSQILATEGPGAAPVLPGINLPFIEGVLALAVLLVVHEGAHGVLARVGKIPLKSAGMVFLGVVPFGAFVDPDERKLQKTDADIQDRVLVAGSASNLFTACAFFALFFMFYYGVLFAFPTAQIGTSSVEVVGVLSNGSAYGFVQPGMKITKWRGTDIASIADFKAAANGTIPGSSVEIVTDKGTFTVPAGKDGKVGVQVQQVAYSFSNYIRDLSKAMPWISFLYNFIGLAFILNVLVGIVNLFPIPPFDGYRILSLKLGNKILFGKVKVMDAIVALIVASFVVNLLPWLWI